MQFAFYFDQTRCTGCHTCAVACTDWHDLPAGSVNWRRVITYEEGRFPDVSVSHISFSCNHCQHPPCIESCPENAIHKRPDDGVVLIDEKKCIGCHACEDACPYAAIQFRPGNDSKAEKCTFCNDRLAGKEPPICVAACPMRALDFGPFDELSKRPGIAGRVVHLPDCSWAKPALIVKTK